MRHADHVRLLAGPYKAPALQRGDRAMCLYRDCEVAVTSWTGARLAWPRCLPVGVRSRPGLLVNDELLRAIRTESAAALKHWFGVSSKAVWQWRKAFGIGRAETEGSRRLIQAAADQGATVLRGKLVPREQVRRTTATRKRLGLRPDRWGKTGWKPEDLALLGTKPDDELAAKLGRSVKAVTVRRLKLGIRTARDGRRREHRA
jgi:hypothetical protein